MCSVIIYIDLFSFILIEHVFELNNWQEAKDQLQASISPVDQVSIYDIFSLWLFCMVYDWQGYHCNLELIYDSMKKVGLAREVNFFTIDSHSCYSPTRFDLVYTIHTGVKKRYSQT